MATSSISDKEKQLDQLLTEGYEEEKKGAQLPFTFKKYDPIPEVMEREAGLTRTAHTVSPVPWGYQNRRSRDPTDHVFARSADSFHDAKFRNQPGRAGYGHCVPCCTARRHHSLRIDGPVSFRPR